MPFKNNLILRAARREETERTPVWLMRQAGRILPQYRKVRASVSGFKELLQNSELASEVTLQPVDVLGVDAAIIFSDILVIPEAMGLAYKVEEGRGPYFLRTIDSDHDITMLKIAEPEEDIAYTLQAMRMVKRELNGRVPLIGFAGAPWTVFCYMTGKSGDKTFAKTMLWIKHNPAGVHRLLEKLTESTVRYLKAQIKAGADIVQLFDTWAGILQEPDYKTFGLPYLGKICDAVTEAPVIVFAKNAGSSLKELGQLNCQVIGLDWSVQPEQARLLANAKALQGNLHPAMLYENIQTIQSETKKMLQHFGHRGHIANLGHGVNPDTPLDNVKCFVDTVKEYKFN